MIRGMPAWSLDGIDFNTGNPDSDGILWVIEEEQGFWGSVGLNATYTPKLNQHGSYRVPGFKERDTITLTCVTRLDVDRYDYAAFRRAQMRVAALCSDSTTLYPLVCHSEIGPLVADVALDGDILTKLRNTQPPTFEWSIQLTAPDPRRYDLSWTRVQTGLPIDSATGLDFVGLGSGLDFDTTGLHFGSGSMSGTVMLTNKGTAPSQPILTLQGPLTNPTIATQGGSITYNGTLAAGEYVVIDPADPSVLKGGTANVSHLVNPANFTAFTVRPGTTLTVGLSHTGPSTDTGTLVVDFRSAWF